MLAKQVAAGKLPSLTKRLPASPYVLPHRWLEPGRYGGRMTIIVPSTSDASIAEWFYGMSPLRLLNDARDVGPGYFDKWSTNAEATEWTFHLREGLRWSDGHPVSTDDIMFWWNDMVLDDDFPEVAPDECKSSKGTICKLTAVDAHTVRLRFDAPAPLTVERLALIIRGYGGIGGSWIVPKHFVKQYHPKYNPKIGKDWASTGGVWETHCSYRLNPKCPTLTEYRLASYSDGRSLTWERNPYCYVLAPNGDQLPYMDEFVMTVVQDPEVAKLKISSGEVDYSHGPFNGIVLADVSTLTKSAKAGGYDVLFWDSGSGTGATFFLCYDYYEPKVRKIFRDPRFRQALSLAFDRKRAKRAIYFEQGTITTGTMSPKAIEFHIDDHGKKVYEQWRTSYLGLDIDRAKKLLDELGMKDRDGDGYRELPDGSTFTLRLDSTGGTSEYQQRDNQLVSDWKKIGIRMKIHPVPPISYSTYWTGGKYMAHSNWEVSDGPNLLVYPQWLVPMESSRWAPLEGEMYHARGTPEYTSERDVDPYKRKPPRMMPDENGPIRKLWDLFDQAISEPDAMKRHRLAWQMCKVHIDDGPFFQGTVAATPQIEIASTDMGNVPRRENLATGGYVNTWVHPTPAVYDPEAYFWKDPDKHKS